MKQFTEKGYKAISEALPIKEARELKVEMKKYYPKVSLYMLGHKKAIVFVSKEPRKVNGIAGRPVIGFPDELPVIPFIKVSSPEEIRRVFASMRKEYRITGVCMSKKIGYHHSNLNHWEKGSREHGGATLINNSLTIRYAKALNIKKIIVEVVVDELIAQQGES